MESAAVSPPERCECPTHFSPWGGRYTFPEPALKLTMHRASYHVEAANSPALSIYERTGPLVSRNESTQLLVSQHALAPFTRHRSGFLAS